MDILLDGCGLVLGRKDPYSIAALLRTRRLVADFQREEG